MDAQRAAELVRTVLPAFEVKELLGVGSYGSVFRIQDALKERAVKIVLLSATPALEQGQLESARTRIDRDFQHIVDSYEKIACEEIVTVHDFYKVTAESGGNQEMAYAIIIMELYPGNLLDYLLDYFRRFNRPVDIDTALMLMEKLATLIGNLFVKRGFLFEDIKPENILVKEKDHDFKVVVGDIGGLKNLGSVTLAGTQVTPAYCAAEVIGRGQKPDLRSLVYSYGLLCYFLLEGHLPYDRSPVAERPGLIRDQGLPIERRDIPPKVTTLLRRCLAAEPAERYRDFREVLEALTGRAAGGASPLDERTIELGGAPREDETITLREPAREGRTPRQADQPVPGMYDAVGEALIMGVLGPRRDQERKHAESMRAGAEKEQVDSITQQIKDLVVRRGDIRKLDNDSFRVVNDIVVEPEGLLSVENARLYFEENAGIVVLGSFRASSSTFGAAEVAKRWRNVTFFGGDNRLNYVKQCQFRLAKGRSWETLKGLGIDRPPGMEERLSYGGGILVLAGAATKLSVTDSTFYHCTASMGGGMCAIQFGGVVESCLFDSCSAVVGGGGLALSGAAPTVKHCTFATCSAGREGGALHLAGANAVVEDCTFKSCASKSLYGGGAYVARSTPLFKGCKFNLCTAGRDGGGIYCDARSKAKVLFPVFSGCKPTNMNSA
jgi:serine/threonine protein kinase